MQMSYFCVFRSAVTLGHYSKVLKRLAWALVHAIFGLQRNGSMLRNFESKISPFSPQVCCCHWYSLVFWKVKQPDFSLFIYLASLLILLTAASHKACPQRPALEDPLNAWHHARCTSPQKERGRERGGEIVRVGINLFLFPFPLNMQLNHIYLVKWSK